MKIIKNISFLYIIKLNLFLILFFLISVYSSIAVKGKKIKNHKTSEKVEIKKNIKNTMLKLKNFPESNDIIKNKNKTVNTEKLSQSAKERYQLKNYYIQTNDNNVIDKNIYIQNEPTAFPFIIKNYEFIQNYFKINNIDPLQHEFKIGLLLLNKYLTSGLPLKKSLIKLLEKIKKIKIPEKTTIFDLIKIKNKNNINEKNENDSKIVNIINKTVIYNGKNKIEKERAINKLYNNIERKEGLLIIQKFNNKNFTIKEQNNTYGDLSPSKDIYEKLIDNKNILYDGENNNKFLIPHRNLPETTPETTEFYSIYPQIKSNMVQYYSVNSNSSHDTLTINKIEDIINNLDYDFFYVITPIPFSQLIDLFGFIT